MEMRPLYLPYISPISPLYLPYISSISPQVGIMEMRPLAERTGGYVVMSESFTGNIFKQSFKVTGLGLGLGLGSGLGSGSGLGLASSSSPSR